MSPERWEHVKDLLMAALELAPDARSAFLNEVCGSDTALRDELDSLLVHADEAPGFFQSLARSVLPHAHDEAFSHTVTGDDPHRLVGQAIFHYQILETLGSGGMGVVYKARDTRLDRLVALKFLTPHLNLDAEAKTRFVVEAKAAAALQHPNICTVYEIGETGEGQLFIAMACYYGQTLKKKIERGPLPVDEAIDYALQVAEGLGEAHAQGIVHRDVKPANVMVTGRGRVKLLDFGLAKVVDTSLTKPDATMGTVAYMSPEQARGEAVDHRTDIWSLGVVLYELLTGERPFRGNYAQAVIYSILNEEPEPLAALRPEIPPDLEQITRKALAKRPEERYAFIPDLIHELEETRTSDSEQALSRRQDSRTERGQLRPEGERIQTTIVVSSLAGYLNLVEHLVPDEVERVMNRLKDEAHKIIQQHGGVVNRFTGEEIVALFGLPTPHEDDPARAVRATLELHACVRTLRVEMEERTGQGMCLLSGIDTGLVIAHELEQADRSYQVTGSPHQVATRLMMRAEDDEVLVSPACQRLVAPFFDTEAGEPVRMKGRKKPITPYRITKSSGLQTRLEAAAQVGLAAFTGREKELNTLQCSLESALQGEGRFVTVVGEAGLGKSRLLYEFRQKLDREAVTLVQGRCQSFGSHIPYMPFIEALRDCLQSDESAPETLQAEDIAVRIREISPELENLIPLFLHLLSLQSERYPLAQHVQGDNLRLAMREGLAALFTLSTRQRPVVLLLEDWHWADEASQDTLNRLVDLIPAHSLLIVSTYRPVYTPTWGHPDYLNPIRLHPLESSGSVNVIASVIGARELPLALSTRLHERTGGNPFFLEEISQALLEDGTVRVEEGQVMLTQSVEQLRLPHTVQAVLQTRLHRLGQGAVQVLLLASVVGREFTRRLLQYVRPDDAGLLPELERLKAAGLIQQTRVLPDVAFRFKHILTQEVAYESLLGHQRRQLHGQVGEALEALYAGEEHSERLAHHFSEAEMWEKAVHYGRKAAERAWKVSRFVDVLNRLESVQGWLLKLPERQQRKDALVDNLLQQEQACGVLGRRERQGQLIDEVFALLDPVKDRARIAGVYVCKGNLYAHRGQFTEAEAALGEALRISHALGDLTGEHRVLRSMMDLRTMQDRLEDALAILQDILAFDQQLDDEQRFVSDLVSLFNLLRRLDLYQHALDYFEEYRDVIEAASPSRQANIQYSIGLIYHSLGDLDRALTHFQKTLSFAEEKGLLGIGIIQSPGSTYIAVANIYFEQGKVEESLRTYQKAIDSGRASQNAVELSGALNAMGITLLKLGRYAEALPYLQESASIYAKLEDHATAGQAWSLIAVAYEGLGQHASAETAWEKTQTLQHQTGNGPGELDALEGLARMARKQDRDPSLVVAFYRDALTLAEQLGNRARQSELLNTLGILLWQQGAYTDALAHYEQALALCREREDPIHAGLMLNSIGVTLRKLDRLEEALAHLEEAITLHRQTGQRTLEGHALAALGDVSFDLGRFEQALAYYGQSLQLRWDLGDRRGEGWMLLHLARVHEAQGEQDRAREYVAQASKIAAECGNAKLEAACRSLRV